ncbi:arsenate reductase family protein [Paenibacillus sp. 481]|uniref:arsenate reductase family protein n=1 Tax=Paenibacillus sp. 481 TaxID=2835869 RepID=UPI001E32E492|nr:arsenate reductase family protein [Paenibacillus sp. 481]UHA72334.1 arsenate reductase family protein [Paenibacillus sp. 481]
MKKLTVYHYATCSTCRNAIKSLQAKGAELELRPIVEQPPTVDELRTLVANSGLELKKWFNTAGEVYRSLQLKDRLKDMSEEEQLELLSSNGKLIKRPIVTDGQRVTVGFKEDTYQEVWS